MGERKSHITRRRLLGTAGAGAAGAAIGGTALGGLGCGDEPEQSTAGTAVEAPKRNVILIVIDSLRADRIGCYGNGEMHTPALDRLASEGTRFTRVFPEAMPTVPARRSILTGRRSFPFRDWEPWWGMAKRPGWRPIMPRERTLVEDMRDNGYWTAYVSDNPFLTVAETFEPFRAKLHRYVPVIGQRGEHIPASSVPLEEARRWLPAAMRDDEREVRAVQRYLANNGRGEHAGQTAAARVFKAAARELDRVPADRPFFLGVDAFDPHEPWAPPPEYLSMYGDPDYDGPEVANVHYRGADYLSPTEIQRLQAIYKASVTMVDDWLGRFLDRVEQRGLAESTVIGLVSDHGVLLGEHRWTGKGDYRLHPELIHVPLIVRDPDGRGAGRESDYFANTIDLGPTLMSLAGLHPAERFEGTDLTPILEGERPHVSRPFTYGGYGNFCYAVDDRWKLITANDRHKHKLFDLEADPGEHHDVSDRHPDVADELYERIVAEIGGRPPTYSDAEFEAPARRLRPALRPRPSGRAGRVSDGGG